MVVKVYTEHFCEKEGINPLGIKLNLLRLKAQVEALQVSFFSPDSESRNFLKNKKTVLSFSLKMTSLCSRFLAQR